jgi:hypothetical protein
MRFELSNRGRLDNPDEPDNQAADSRIGRRLGWIVPRLLPDGFTAPAEGEIEAAVFDAEGSKGTGTGR